MQGYFGKYKIEKADGTPIDPNADYFVLRLDTDPDARAALRLYAKRVYRYNPVLARDLLFKLESYKKGTGLKPQTKEQP